MRSRAKLAYDAEQARLDDGRRRTRRSPCCARSACAGRRRRCAAGRSTCPVRRRRSARTGGGISLVYRTSVPVEEWNAQLSLMTGMAAARIMLDGGVGILRTMPPPSDQDLARVRASARGLGIAWPEGRGYAHVIRSLDPGDPQHAAFLDNVTTLMRGRGLHGVRRRGAGAVGALGDRRALRPRDRAAAPAGGPVRPGRLPGPGGGPRRARRASARHCRCCPASMTASGRRARAVERGCLDYLEAEMLAGREGVAFRGVVIEQRKDGGIVQLADPAITARCRGDDLPGRAVGGRAGWWRRIRRGARSCSTSARADTDSMAADAAACRSALQSRRHVTHMTWTGW